jgi:hypothetical protein
MGIEPTSPAWKAGVIAIIRHPPRNPSPNLMFLNIKSRVLVEGGGFEPPKAEPADLQSAPFGRSGTPPIQGAELSGDGSGVSTAFSPVSGAFRPSRPGPTIARSRRADLARELAGRLNHPVVRNLDRLTQHQRHRTILLR